MKYEDIGTVDFETEAIESRPHYPPRPVGVALRYPGGKKEWLAWGHPTKNNCDVATAYRKLKEVYESPGGVLAHNGMFDFDVAECAFGLKMPAKRHDTLFLSFLKDPYEETISLKPLATKYLDIPPDEQEDLRDWILANVPELGRRKTKWGEYICKAPGDLVGRYAVGDVDRTFKLFKAFYPEIVERGMLEAYERELRVMPITLEMERSGVKLNVTSLKNCLSVFQKMDADVCRRIARKLGVSARDLKSEDNKKGFNLDSGKQLGEALIRAGKLDAVIKTPTGQVSTKIVNLRATCNDPELLQLLSVHSVAEKYISSFMEPWLERAAITGGRLQPTFNQVRARGDDGGGGARSGRYSSSDPNLQNISSNVAESRNRETLELMAKWLEDDYHYPFIGLRDFIVPDDGMTLISADYSQQELRIFAHFENGILAEAYRRDPNMDVHDYIRQEIHRSLKLDIERKAVKIIVFGIIYGMGLDKLSDGLGVSKQEAGTLKNAVFKAVPGIPAMVKELRYLANHNRPLRTWGGREYYCEEPRYDKRTKQWRSFEYKMLNYKIQPSAADCTKQGMINVNERLGDEVRIAVQVHDELVCMAPSAKYVKPIIDAMCDVEFNVPMMADAKHSDVSWARAKNA